jgi:uncharacterized protein YyaL (SSP411 family)
LNWLVHSDVRLTNEGPAQGGVCQGYNWKKRSYPFVYSEITGYAVSTFNNAFRWTGEEQYLTLAKQSSDFLLKLQNVTAPDEMVEAIPHGLSLPELQPLYRYYSFDAAMCLQGILDLDAVCPSPELHKSARAIGDWLVERMQEDNGSFLSMYDAENRKCEHNGENFFDDNGCLHAKHAIGLLKLAHNTGNECYTEAARRVCDWVLKLQDDNGAFRANERLQHTVSHAHCYATEGLLYAYHVLGTGSYLKAARRSGKWLLGAQTEDGSIYIDYKRRWWRMGRRVTEIIFPRRVTDATAQAIRIWLILYYLDRDQQFLEASYRAADFLQGMQCAVTSDRNALGGFYFWPDHPIMFAWCTMFAIHALYALEHVDRQDGYKHLITELF